MANILAIDDEPVLLALISATLRQDGHDVVAMTDPLAAVDCFIAGRVKVDLLLTDVTMIPISGFEMLKRLTNLGFDGPALFMSGYSALSGFIVGSLGARAVIEKPFTAARLRAAVTKALAKNKTKVVRAA
jgi:CheY-like chemotaxis protein